MKHPSMKSLLLAVAAASLTFGSAYAQVAVSPDPGASPYATIGAALTAADTLAAGPVTVTVDGATYNGTTERVLITRADITLTGINNAELNPPTVNSPNAMVFIRSVNGVTVSNLKINVTAPYAGAGIIFKSTSVAGITTLNILNNNVQRSGSYAYVVNTGTNGQAGDQDNGVASPNYAANVPFGNATGNGYGSQIGIFVGNGSSSTSVLVPTIKGNTVGSATNPFPIFGIGLERVGGGNVGGPGVGEGNTIYGENFAAFTRFVSGLATWDSNTIYGWGDERNRGAIASMEDISGAGDVLFKNNTVTMLSGRSPQGFVGRRAVQTKNVYSVAELRFNNNTVNTYNVGFAITNTQKSFLSGNTVNALGNNALLVELNNKIYSSGNSFVNTGFAFNTPRVFGNTFNAGGFTGVTGIEVRDHTQNNSGSTPAAKIVFRSMALGNQAAPNVFDDGLAFYIKMNDFTGATNTSPFNASPTAPYGFRSTADTVGGAWPTGYPAPTTNEAQVFTSTMVKADYDVFVDQNRYEVAGVPKFPFQMTSGEITAVEAKLQDQKDDAALGYMILDRSFAADTDRDGLPDTLETSLSSSTSSKDSDSDGIEDGVEFIVGGSPTSTTGDTDADGCPNSVDPGNTDPDGAGPRTATDWDGDGYDDFYEILVGTDASDIASKPRLGDVNNTGTADFADGVKMMRLFVGLDSLSPTDIPELYDVNRDGLNDNIDAVITINLFLGNLPGQALPF